MVSGIDWPCDVKKLLAKSGPSTQDKTDLSAPLLNVHCALKSGYDFDPSEHAARHRPRLPYSRGGSIPTQKSDEARRKLKVA